jgi:hypothetical protein
VWMSWYVGGPVVFYHNATEAVTAPSARVTINPARIRSSYLAPPGYITVTVCSNYQGMALRQASRPLASRAVFDDHATTRSR